MLTVKFFAFNPAHENTYILHDETHECVIIDAGCYTAQEQAILKDYISDKKLKPVMLLCTHTHFDHILGNRFIFDTYGLTPIFHKKESDVFAAQEGVCKRYEINYDPSPMAEKFIEEGDKLTFGNTTLDVLFKGTIGRTDIPLANHADLENSILTKLYTLPDETTVYTGHGPVTNIGYEKTHNMFVTVD